MYGQNDATQAAYGSTTAPSKPAGSNKRLNLRTVFLSFLIPCVTFCTVSSLLTSRMRQTQPFLVNLALVLILVGVLPCCTLAANMTRKWYQGLLLEFPFWYVFMAMFTALAYGTGYWFAELNFYNNMAPYQAITSLASAYNVDPATTPSARYLDVGSISFVKGTTLDLKKSVGFKNHDVYCVAPIVHDTGSNKSLRSASFGSYDYWAVGLNCCSGDGFVCGQYANPKARSGMRLMREDQRAFYQLAVQEAEVTFGIRANNPLFFFWVEEPKQEEKALQVDTRFWWEIGILAFCAFQLLFTVAAVWAYSVFKP